MYHMAYPCYDTIGISRGTPITKKRRLMFALLTIVPKEGWSSEFNLDDKWKRLNKRWVMARVYWKFVWQHRSS